MSQTSILGASAPANAQELAVKIALSGQRLSTFELATTVTPVERGALALYAWNAQVAAAMLAPLHICEVTIRNAVSDAISNVYGPDWPWEPAFQGSLPNKGKWKMRNHLDSLATRMPKAGGATTGKLIPELSFVFWEKMLTQRFDAQIWIPHLRTVFPNLPITTPIHTGRGDISNELEKLRRLRNRIAHHEPIISRNLNQDLQKIFDLISYRCQYTATWLLNNQQAATLINQRPA